MAQSPTRQPVLRSSGAAAAEGGSRSRLRKARYGGRSKVGDGAWTSQAVKARFREAAQTLRRLHNLTNRDVPMVRDTYWPTIVRPYVEGYGWDAPRSSLGAPAPGAIDRLDEAIGWASDWLEDYERHLVWERAFSVRWKVLEAKLGCDRTTAWRHYVFALVKVAAQLNARDGQAAGNPRRRDCHR